MLDKLYVDDGLKVPEVWLFERGKLSIYNRKPKGGYTRVRRSRWLKDLDPKLIEKYAAFRDQEEAVLAFSEEVRKQRQRSKRPSRRHDA